MFPHRYPIIGMIHLPPLPDMPDSPGIKAIVDSALADLATLIAGGVDGVLIENEYDRPHRVTAGEETVAAMTEVTRAVVAAGDDVVVGCEILLNDPNASLQVAQASGARFIRTDYFVDRMSRPEYGEFAIDPDGLVAQRSSMAADDVLILADIQVKYANMLDRRTLRQSAQLASDKLADAIVVTGDASGDAPASAQLVKAAAGASVPVLIGSGLDSQNARDILPASDGAIIGTSLMRDRRVSLRATRELMSEVGRLRAS